MEHFSGDKLDRFPEFPVGLSKERVRNARDAHLPHYHRDQWPRIKPFFESLLSEEEFINFCKYEEEISDAQKQLASSQE
jgi:hypothetical protein